MVLIQSSHIKISHIVCQKHGLTPVSPGGAGRAGRAAGRVPRPAADDPMPAGPGAFSGVLSRMCERAGPCGNMGFIAAQVAALHNGPRSAVQYAGNPVAAGRGGGRRQRAGCRVPGAGIRGGGIAAHGPRWALPGTFQAGRGRRAGASLTHKKTPGRYPRGVVCGAGPLYSSGRCRTIFHQNSVKASVRPITVGG